MLFILWTYFYQLTIKHHQRNIRKYRAQGDYEKERAEIRTAQDAWADALIKKAKIKINVSGTENIPEGTVLFVSNHQSYWDIPVFLAAIRGKQFGFIAKSDLSKLPSYGEWMIDIRCVFIEREDTRASLKAIEEGINLLKQGFSLVIFPEGTRSKGREMGKFKKGSLRLATKTGIPIVPITIDGTYKAYEEKGYLQPASVSFKIHKPIETKGMSRKEIAELPEKVEKIIRDGLF